MAVQHRVWCGIALMGILLNDAPASAVAAEPSGGQSRGQPAWLSSAGARPQPEAVQPPHLFQRQQGILRAHELLAQASDQRSSPYPPEVLGWQHQASILYQQGKYQEAAQIQEKELAWTEQNLGPDHPDTAQSLSSLALLYYSQGAYAKAEPLHLRALAIREKALGPDHPDTAQSLENLGALYAKQGAYAKAEPLYIRALAIMETGLGSNHPSTIEVRENLEQCRKALGNKVVFLRNPATSRPVISHRYRTI